MLPLVHELRVLLAADEGTAGRRAMVGATRRELRLDVHSRGESAFQLRTDAWALGTARPPAMVAQLGRAAGTVYDTRPDSERLATLCTAIGDTSALVHAIHLQRCPGQLNKLLIERAPWLPLMRNDVVFKRLQVLARGGEVRLITRRGGRWQHGNPPKPQCRECGTTTSTRWFSGYTLCNPCGCRLWRSGGASQAPALPPAMSSAPP